MADSTRIRGEQVRCHECSNVWPREHGGLQCPRCESEFVEIESESNPPSPELSPQNASADDLRLTRSRSLDSLERQRRWEDAPDPGEDDISDLPFGGYPQPRGYHWERRSPNGGSSFSFSMISTSGGPTRITTNRSRGAGGEGVPFGDPAMMEVQNNFEDMIQTIMGVRNPQPSRSRGPGPGRMPIPGFPFTPLGPSPQVGEADASIMGLFSSIFQTLGGGGTLHHMMDPANAGHGDAVFTQEALDQVISRLMEQSQGSNAPGPASEAAIRSLPQRKVEKEMLDEKGKAECSICMDSVELGEQVTVLPCTHWFHQSCITAWLKEHDTCPHCRKGISPQPQANGSPPRGSGRPSSLPPRPRSDTRSESWQRSPQASRSPLPGEEPSPGSRAARADRDLRSRRLVYREFDRRSGHTRDFTEPISTSPSNRRINRSDTHWSSSHTPSRNPSHHHRHRHRSYNNEYESNNDRSNHGGGITGWLRYLSGGG